jgi:hypothetical protein
VKIFCLEGDWDQGADSKLSVRPLLELIHVMGFSDGTIHHNAATTNEFDHYLDQWLGMPAEESALAYLASHGSAHGLWLSDGNEISLQRLAGRLKRRASGRVLYFGACQVLDLETEELNGFCDETGIAAVAGYTRTVDWAESASADMLAINHLMRVLSDGRTVNGNSLRPLYDKFARSYPGILNELGFRIVTASWSSADTTQ